MCHSFVWVCVCCLVRADRGWRPQLNGVEETPELVLPDLLVLLGLLVPQVLVVWMVVWVLVLGSQNHF